MHFILDTNVLYGRPRLQGVDLHVLLKARRLGHAVHIPQVVLDEFERQVFTQADKHLSAIETAKRNLVAIFDQPVTVALPDMDKAKREYSAWLKSKLDAAKVDVVPYPSVDGQLLVRRELAGRKPFRGGDQEAGHRDFFVWLAVLDVACKGSDPVVFISDNTSDFTDGSGHLHADLAQDLVERKIDPARIRWFPKLQQAIEKLIKPAWPSNDSLLKIVRQPAWLSFFSNWLATSSEAKAMMAAARVRSPQLLVGKPIEAVTPVIEAVEDVEVVDARDLVDGEQLIELRATVDARLTVVDRMPELPVDGGPLLMLSFALLSMLPFRQRYRLQAELTLSKSPQAVTSVSLVNLETRGEPERLGR